MLAGCADSALTYGGTKDNIAAGSQQASADTLGQQGRTSGVREEASLDKAVTLIAGGTYFMELSLERSAESEGFSVGLGAMELNAVSEPAAASLGLAGLFILMMRRRWS